MSQFENCVSYCPRVAICQQFTKTGEADMRAAEKDVEPFFTGGAEFIDDDGNLVGGDEFFGFGAYSPAVIARREAAEALMQSGATMRALLLEGCDGEPIPLGDGKYVCHSANSQVAAFTEQDLRGLVD